MSRRQMWDGTVVERADIICARCRKPLAYEPPPAGIDYWFAFCGPACATEWADGRTARGTEIKPQELASIGMANTGGART